MIHLKHRLYLLFKCLIWVVFHIILMVSYFLLIGYSSENLSESAFYILNSCGRLFYFLPLIILIKKVTNTNFEKQLFKPKSVEIIITILLVIGLFLILGFFIPTIKVSDYRYLNIVNYVILAPLLEEMFFRGIILNKLLKEFNPYLAIIFVSFLFSLSHLSVKMTLSSFILSLIISLIYFKFRKSLIISIIFHLLWNALHFLPSTVM